MIVKGYALNMAPAYPNLSYIDGRIDWILLPGQQIHFLNPPWAWMLNVLISELYLSWVFQPSIYLLDKFVNKISYSAQTPFYGFYIKINMQGIIQLCFLPWRMKCKSISFFWEGNGNPFQYCCLENPMGGGAW